MSWSTFRERQNTMPDGTDGLSDSNPTPCGVYHCWASLQRSTELDIICEKNVLNAYC